MTVIKVENLSKKYIIRHQLAAPYMALRDEITESFRSIFDWKRWGKLQSPRREEFWALSDLNFDIKQGDRLGIIGKNGAGKSTILKVLSRITDPTRGRISIKGRTASLLEVGTGFHPELTGRENIYLNGAVLGMKKAEIKRKFNEIVAFAEVEKFLDTPVKRFSSGMFVRLAFAVAAHLEPEILIVDEVLAVGDVQFQKRCLGKMEDVSKRDGRTIVFVSHDMGAVQSLCNRCLVLDKGKFIFHGEPGEAVDYYLNASSGQADQSQVEWQAPRDKVYPLSEYLKVEKFFVADDDGKKQGGALLNSKSYNAIIELKLAKPDPNIIIALAYYAPNGSLLFINNIVDAKHIKLDELSPGNYRVGVKIPVELFASGECFMEVLCLVHMAGWILPVDNESRIKVEFYRDIEPTTEIALGRHQPLMPAYRWQIEKLGA